MPDYGPQEFAPANLWVGQQESKTYMDALGVGWAAPLTAWANPRIVNIASLCAGPPPTVDSFTSVDLVQGYIPGGDHTAMIAKLEAFTDRGVWFENCRAIDAPPPVYPSGDPRPPELPDGPTPAADEDAHRKILRLLAYIRDASVGREQKVGPMSTVSGEGSLTIVPNIEGDGDMWAAGVRIEVSEKPDYAASSGGSINSMWYDLGWVSVANDGYSLPPVRINRLLTMIYPCWPPIKSLTYSLPAGVSIQVWPLYPKGGLGAIGE